MYLVFNIQHLTPEQLAELKASNGTAETIAPLLVRRGIEFSAHSHPTETTAALRRAVHEAALAGKPYPGPRLNETPEQRSARLMDGDEWDGEVL